MFIIVLVVFVVICYFIDVGLIYMFMCEGMRKDVNISVLISSYLCICFVLVVVIFVFFVIFV